MRGSLLRPPPGFGGPGISGEGAVSSGISTCTAALPLPLAGGGGCLNKHQRKLREPPPAALRASTSPASGRGKWSAPFVYRLICALNVSSTTRSNDDAFGGALSRASATNLSRFTTSA